MLISFVVKVKMFDIYLFSVFSYQNIEQQNMILTPH